MSQHSLLSLGDKAFISVRIVTMDYTLEKPIENLDPLYSATRGHVVKRVPIIRIFGITPAGQKICFHVHGIFPYFYVPMPRSPPEGFESKLASSLDKAINLSMAVTAADKNPQIFKVQPVTGVPFYGYHSKKHKFLKIYLYNPSLVKRAGDLLLNGAVMGMKLQPHESHVPFALQFMMDFNLQGMNFIHFSHCKFRRRKTTETRKSFDEDEDLFEEDELRMKGEKWLDVSQLPENSQRLFKEDELPDFLFLDSVIEPVSTCELEADGVAADILNSNDIAEGSDGAGMNPGLEAIWEDERLRREILGIEEPLTAPDSPPRTRATLSTKSDQFWKDQFREKIKKWAENGGLTSGMDSQVSDPDSTCNFDPKEGKNEVLAQVYADELNEDGFEEKSASATSVVTHVDSLLGSMLLEDAERQKSPFFTDSPSENRHDDTIVDEQVIFSQSLSNASQKSNLSALLDQDDKDLVDLLTELGAQKLDGDVVQALSQNSDRARQQLKEEADETLEMSQILDANDLEAANPELDKDNNDTDQVDILLDSQDDSFFQQIPL